MSFRIYDFCACHLPTFRDGIRDAYTLRLYSLLLTRNLRATNRTLRRFTRLLTRNARVTLRLLRRRTITFRGRRFLRIRLIRGRLFRDFSAFATIFIANQSKSTLRELTRSSFFLLAW